MYCCCSGGLVVPLFGVLVCFGDWKILIIWSNPIAYLHGHCQGCEGHESSDDRSRILPDAQEGLS